jgi:hypothetical protein
MTYTEFKDFLMLHLWKQGDTAVIAALDTLIVLATSELNRLLKVEQRSILVDLPVTATQVPLPADCREVRHLQLLGVGPMQYAIPAQFANFLQLNVGNTDLNYYTVVNNVIQLLGSFSVEVPAVIRLTYYANLPDFKATDASWVADDFLDVLLYATLKHSAPFLREDDRVKLWLTMYGDALASAIVENEDRKYAGSPLRINFGDGIA